MKKEKQDKAEQTKKSPSLPENRDKGIHACKIGTCGIKEVRDKRYGYKNQELPAF